MNFVVSEKSELSQPKGKNVGKSSCVEPVEKKCNHPESIEDLIDQMDSDDDTSIIELDKNDFDLTPYKKIVSLDTFNTLEFLVKMNFVFGSIKISWELNKKEEYKKKAIPKTGWPEAPTFYNPEMNGVYVVTGIRSNCFVVDIDDMTAPEAKYIKEKCDACCNMSIETNKGYHYYFKYCEDMSGNFIVYLLFY